MADYQPIRARSALQPLKKNGKPYPKRRPRHWCSLRSVWKGMIKRCCDPYHIGYMHYGGRGITVSAEWLESFDDFYDWALTSGYSRGLVLDRKSNNEGYSAQNCRWVTPLVNSRNKRNNHFVTAFGETKTLTDWAADSRCTVGRNQIGRRLAKGWGPERAITEAPFTSSSKKNHCRAIGMDTFNRVTELLAEGRSNVEIGGMLGVSDVFVSLVRRGKTWHSRSNRAPLFDEAPAVVQRELI